MRLPGGREALVGALAMLQAGCSSDVGLGGPCDAPSILETSVSSNPENVLAAFVSVRVRGADSVGVIYRLVGDAVDSLAPRVMATAEPVEVPVLGLHPARGYSMRAVAWGACGRTIGPPTTYTTSALPRDMPVYRAGGTDPSAGFVVFSAGVYGLAIDNTGRVVWYHRFGAGAGLNFQVLPNGHYVARPASAGVPARWLEIDPRGRIVRSFGCARDLQPRFHDLAMRADGSYWTLCDETKTMDLSAHGGVADARVLAQTIQHVSATGSLLFEWSPFDHLEITDLPAADLGRREVNWTHANSLDIDDDGNLQVSFRNLNEVTGIDTRTGAVRWRMGGRADQFAWRGTSGTGFAGQHGLRVTGPGEFVVLDNLGDPMGSRAERYAYHERERWVELVQTYGPEAGLVAQLGGATQPLPRGRVLVAYGNAGRVVEYDATGRVMWRIEGDAGYVYRAQRIQSLYRPGVEDLR